MRDRAERRRARGEEHARLDADLAALEADAAELEAFRARLGEQLGLDPGRDDLGVVEWARRLHAHREAVTALRRAEADGVFRDLPGRGRPLALEDLSDVPAELRAEQEAVRRALQPRRAPRRRPGI